LVRNRFSPRRPADEMAWDRAGYNQAKLKTDLLQLAASSFRTIKYWRRSMGFQGKFYASKLELRGLESEDPGTVFNLIAVV